VLRAGAAVAAGADTEVTVVVTAAGDMAAVITVAGVMSIMAAGKANGAARKATITMTKSVTPTETEISCDDPASGNRARRSYVEAFLE
jgi:hypothetical protein